MATFFGIIRPWGFLGDSGTECLKAYFGVFVCTLYQKASSKRRGHLLIGVYLLLSVGSIPNKKDKAVV